MTDWLKLPIITNCCNNFGKNKSAWEEYLFREFSEQYLSGWAKRLKYFRFFRAYGGHNNDLDKIVLALSYAGEDYLTTLFDNLCVPYKRHLVKPPQPEPRKSYSGADFAKFPSLIPGTNWIEQPIWQTIDSVIVSIWCTNNSVEITVVGPKEEHWQITDIEFKKAERLEIIFEKYAQRIIDPPIDSRNCICPKYYPQYWSAG